MFKSCITSSDRISPSLWTICNAAPYHARKTLNEYGLGLGSNTMEGREQKHQAIEKYSKNTTFQNRWPLIFRHEYVQLIYLRENGFDNVRYMKRGVKYIPESNSESCNKCCSKLKNDKCLICDSKYMKVVLKEVGIC